MTYDRITEGTTRSSPPRPPLYGFPLAVDDYQFDRDLYDRFVAYSAEIDRLALLAIAVIGFALGLLDKQDGSRRVLLEGWVWAPTALGLAALCLAAGLCLAHRWLSTEGLYELGRCLRAYRVAAKDPGQPDAFAPAGSEETEARRNMRRCYRRAEKVMYSALWLLFLGLVLVSLGFFQFLRYSTTAVY